MKTVTEAVRSVPLRSLLTGFLPAAAAFLLSGAALGGLYSPWALAAVSGAGILIFCANTAFCTTRLYRRPVFRPVAAE